MEYINSFTITQLIILITSIPILSLCSLMFLGLTFYPMGTIVFQDKYMKPITTIFLTFATIGIINLCYILFIECDIISLLGGK